MNIKSNAKLFLKSYLGKNYPIYKQYVAKYNNQFKHMLVNANTDIVIEGTPRSANSFAFQAFKKAQDYDVNIAHHLHVSCQVRNSSSITNKTSSRCCRIMGLKRA